MTLLWNSFTSHVCFACCFCSAMSYVGSGSCNTVQPTKPAAVCRCWGCLPKVLRSHPQHQSRCFPRKDHTSCHTEANLHNTSYNWAASFCHEHHTHHCCTAIFQHDHHTRHQWGTRYHCNSLNNCSWEARFHSNHHTSHCWAAGFDGECNTTNWERFGWWCRAVCWWFSRFQCCCWLHGRGKSVIAESIPVLKRLAVKPFSNAFFLRETEMDFFSQKNVVFLLIYSVSSCFYRSRHNNIVFGGSLSQIFFIFLNPFLTPFHFHTLQDFLKSIPCCIPFHTYTYRHVQSIIMEGEKVWAVFQIVHSSLKKYLTLVKKKKKVKISCVWCNKWNQSKLFLIQPILWNKNLCSRTFKPKWNWWSNHTPPSFSIHVYIYIYICVCVLNLFAFHDCHFQCLLVNYLFEKSSLCIWASLSYIL